jgi:RNA polymerase sigma-70 factor (ECF subfamily)
MIWIKLNENEGSCSLGRRKLQLTFKEINEVVENYGASLYQFCCRLEHNQSDADDLYQETFVKLVERYYQIDMNRNPKSYLFSIAIHLWKSKCRKWARRQTIAPTTELDLDMADKLSLSNTIENDYIDSELHRVLYAKVGCLKDKYKIPLYLSYTIGMTTDEIAVVMKIPAGTVKSRLHKARQILKKELAVAGYYGLEVASI